MELDQVAARIGDEGLVARSHRFGVAHLHSPLAQLGDRGVEVGDQQGEVLAEACRRLAFDEVDLLPPGVQPGAPEPEVGPVVAGFQAEDIGVEAQSRLHVVDVDGHMVDCQWTHDSSVVALASFRKARPGASCPAAWPGHASLASRRVIEEIVPAVVAAEEAFDDPPDVALFPEEEAYLARSVDKRRREFTTARLCARRACARLGVDPAPIVPGRRGAPQWPPGLVGSITHCAGYRAAAVARVDELMAVGIDAEPNEVLPDGVLAVITRPEERAFLPALRAAAPDICWDRLLFCAKESVFKTWFPLTGRELGFEDATVSFDPQERTFQVRVLATSARVGDRVLTGFSGRWTEGSGLVLAVITVPSEP